LKRYSHLGEIKCERGKGLGLVAEEWFGKRERHKNLFPSRSSYPYSKDIGAKGDQKSPQVTKVEGAFFRMGPEKFLFFNLVSNEDFDSEHESLRMHRLKAT